MCLYPAWLYPFSEAFAKYSATGVSEPSSIYVCIPGNTANNNSISNPDKAPADSNPVTYEICASPKAFAVSYVFTCSVYVSYSE